MKEVEYNGVVMKEMNTEAIILRKPLIALIDELAHTNVPGSKYKKRYEDVEETVVKLLKKAKNIELHVIPNDI